MLYSKSCLSRAAPCAAGPVRMAAVPGTALGSLLGVRSRSCDDVCCGCGPNRVAILQGNSTSPQKISQQSLDSCSQLEHVHMMEMPNLLARIQPTSAVFRPLTKYKDCSLRMECGPLTMQTREICEICL